ncbi:hypothetical protein ACFU99_05785 [Streptomyces sp. NPDC057654]|uniref:hypothetical protein n=1 Tax=Streptomyces sp. NPDC057654 TaxID=3346196 RepID=UPI0036C73154
MPQDTFTVEQQNQAAEDFVNRWCETVDPDSRKFGADLDCVEARTMARLFEVFGFYNTARQLLEEHGENCPHTQG